jgi:predicted TIM-barrel fold metal-dependent hydrolase
MLIHQGTTFVRFGPLIHARPILIDEIARLFPNLKIVIAHIGHPWIEETVAVIRKHPNVYADISALHPRPWQFYQALLCAVEYRADRKLLLGSDYPFFTPLDTIQALRNVNGVLGNTHLPRIPESVVEGIINRPSLELLGIE